MSIVGFYVQFYTKYGLTDDEHALVLDDFCDLCLEPLGLQFGGGRGGHRRRWGGFIEPRSLDRIEVDLRDRKLVASWLADDARVRRYYVSHTVDLTDEAEYGRFLTRRAWCE